MPRTRWIKVDATIVECFRASGEPPQTPHPLFEIVAEIKTPSGQVERVNSQQKLHTLTHRWRPPEPGDVVSASWDRADLDPCSRPGPRCPVQREVDQGAREDT